MNSTSKAYKSILGENEFVYLDIGARGGPQKKLKKLFDDNIIKIILVELEEVEAKKLKKNYIVCDKPIWRDKCKKNIFLTKNKSYSSLLKPNKNVLEGTYYYDRNFYEVEKIITTKTTTLKDVIDENKKLISQIDFIKIDIQGAEGYLFQSFDTEIWSNLIGCETEAYTSELYEDTLTADKIISEFYNQNFEIYDLKNISSMTMTSFMDKNIFSKDLFEARPKSRYYKGKNLVYDILFFKKIDKIIKDKNSTQIRKIIFILMVYGYYDFAFFTLLKSEHNKIFQSKDFDIIKKSIKEIIDLNLPLFWRIKEKLLLKNYKLNIR